MKALVAIWAQRLMLASIAAISVGTIGARSLPVPGNVTVADVVLALGAALAWATGQRFSWRRLDLPLGALLLGILASVIAHPSRGGFGEIAKLGGCLLFFFVVRQFVEAGRGRSVALALAFGAGIAAFVSLVAMGWATLDPAGTRFWTLGAIPRSGGALALPRPSGFFSTPAMFVNFLTVAAPISVALFADRPQWMRTGAASLALLHGILGASQALAGLLLALTFVSWPQLSRLKRWFAAASTIVVFVAATLSSTWWVRYRNSAPRSFPPQNYTVFVDGANWIAPGARLEWQHYAALKAIAVEVFIGSPYTGLGPDTFGRASMQAFREGRLTRRHAGFDPHCTLTGALAETGLVGTVPLLWVWLSWLHAARNSRRFLQRAAAGAVLGIGLNSVHADVMHFRFLWIAVAIMTSHERRGPAKSDARGLEE